MFDHHEYEALEAEAFLKGQARGRDSERKKNDAEKLKIADFSVLREFRKILSLRALV